MLLDINDNKAIVLAWGICFYKSGTNSPKKGFARINRADFSLCEISL